MDIPFRKSDETTKISEMLSRFDFLSDAQRNFYELKKEVPMIDDVLARALTDPDLDLQKVKQRLEEENRKMLEELTQPMEKINDIQPVEVKKQDLPKNYLQNATLNLNKLSK